MRSVFSEFFENYLSLDSRLGRTLFPFFFKPGYLSSQFISGVRRNYANPFRLYIFSSIFFFFCFSGNINQGNEEAISPVIIENSELKDFPDLPIAERESLNKRMRKSFIQELNSDSNSTFAEGILSLPGRNQKKVLALLSDSVKNQLPFNADSIINESTAGITYTTNSDGPIVDFDFEEIDPYLHDRSYTNEMLYDSLTKGQDPGIIMETIYRKGIELSRSDPRAMQKQIIGNMSLAMFVLIPMFAFFVMLFYYGKNKYYVAHLIHTIYLQSFAFFIFGFAFLFDSIFDFKEMNMFLILQVLAVLFTIYFIASFRRIYKEKRWALLLKSFTLIGIYHFLAIIVALGEILVSLFLF